MKDSEWIADLLRHGLIASSFVPPKPIRELRDLLRYRRKVVESRSAERNRLLKLLETANIKLSSVATNVFGVSGMLMLNAILKDDSSPAQTAQLAKGRMRSKIPELKLALEGSVQEHHRFLLRLQLRRLKQADEDLAELDQRIDERLEPYREQQALLVQIPGIDRIGAAVIIAELGTDMTVFHSAKRLAAWAGVCPGNNESAGKRKSERLRIGNVHLKTALVEAGRGHKRAAVAIGPKSSSPPTTCSPPARATRSSESPTLTESPSTGSPTNLSTGSSVSATTSNSSRRSPDPPCPGRRAPTIFMAV